jgi:hypothetical protein
VSGSGANPASANNFSGGAFPSGTVTFASGESSQTITVNVIGDSNVEQDEGFTVSLSSASKATIATASAGGTIMKDDTAAPLVVQVTNSPRDGLLAIGETVVVSVLF